VSRTFHGKCPEIVRLIPIHYSAKISNDWNSKALSTIANLLENTRGKSVGHFPETGLSLGVGALRDGRELVARHEDAAKGCEKNEPRHVALRKKKELIQDHDAAADRMDNLEKIGSF